MDNPERRLSRNERLILILYYYEQMTIKEISMILGLSQARVNLMLEAVRDHITD